MAFFDKLNDLARNIGDKASDAMETTKLNAKSSSERTAAGEDLKKIGEYYYNLFLESGEAVPEILEYCQSAKAHYDAAEEAKAEIERIRAANAAAAAATQSSVQAAAPTTGGAVCASCGAENAAGTRFCQNCGNQLEIPPEPRHRFCPGCGAEAQPGMKFCNQCGYRLEG